MSTWSTGVLHPCPVLPPDSTAPFHRLLVCPFLPPCPLPPSLCLSKPSQHPGHPPSRAFMQRPISGHPPNPAETLPWPHLGFYGSFLDLGIRWHIWDHGVCGRDVRLVMCTRTEHLCVCVLVCECFCVLCGCIYPGTTSFFFHFLPVSAGYSAICWTLCLQRVLSRKPHR